MSMFNDLTQQAEYSDLRKFLERTLPPSGTYMAWTKEDKRNHWCNNTDELAQTIEAFGERDDIYFAVETFLQAGTEYKGRTQDNVNQLKCFRLDLDAGEKKLATQGPDKVYANQQEAIASVVEFTKETGLLFSYLNSSGEGLHVYYELDEPIIPEQWRPVALAFQEFGKAHGLKIDSAVTVDSARVLRPVGTFHPNGKRVTALKETTKVFTLQEFADKVGYRPTPKWDTSINDEALAFNGPPKSFKKIVMRCAAIEEAYTNQEQVEEPFWRAALGVTKFTVEGRDAAHAISKRHSSYDEDEVDEKFDRWQKGPSLCSTFAEFCTKCNSCKFQGKIKTPVQLGGLTVDELDTLPAELVNGSALTWIDEMNQRYAQVRVGDKVMIADNRTPYPTANGVRYGLGFMSMEAFKAMLKGELLAVETGENGEIKHVGRGEAWLRDPRRRRYQAVAFLPGEDAPQDVLNLWSGFGAAPIAGDISLWLQLVEGLIPDETDRNYAINWCAFLVQKLNKIPDVVLALIGPSKGTGKNSMFDPLVSALGKHAMIVDDPGLIVGRFNGHLLNQRLLVCDEAMFAGNPQQQDKIKAKITAKSTTYEMKGVDAQPGVNHCAYVILTNHPNPMHMSLDERRQKPINVSDTLKGNFEFWTMYHAWAEGSGPSALLHFLLNRDIQGFNPRQVPQSETLRRQKELSSLRDPVVAWWNGCLFDGVVSWRDGLGIRSTMLNPDSPTQVDSSTLSESYLASVRGRGAHVPSWPQVAKQIHAWCGPEGLKKSRPRTGSGDRTVRYTLPPLSQLCDFFLKATGVRVVD